MRCPRVKEGVITEQHVKFFVYKSVIFVLDDACEISMTWVGATSFTILVLFCEINRINESYI